MTTTILATSTGILHNPVGAFWGFLIFCFCCKVAGIFK